MKIDELLLVIKSKYDKIKSDTKDLIGLTEKLDNTTSKLSNEFNDLTNPLDKLQNKLKTTKEQYDKLNQTLKLFTMPGATEFKARDLTAFSTEDLKERLKNVEQEYNSLLENIQTKSKSIDLIEDDDEYNKAIDSLNILQSAFSKTQNEALALKQALSFKEKTGMSFDEATANLEKYKQEIEDTRIKIDEMKKPVIIPKINTDPIKQVGKDADDSAKKVNKIGRETHSTTNIFSNLGKNLKGTSGLFKNLSKNFDKGLDTGFKKLKKLTLGLIGVRTMMSLLTKSVNAYLSFDSELQESLTNSWNKLGALLAPAIELVANLFAIATDYIAQFVNALTGIDLVARANAKSLESQAKATKKVQNAQKGLLSMHEITNLPTESITEPASQIKYDDTIKHFKLFDDLVDAIKHSKWHVLGENIGESIQKALKNIPWSKIRKGAYNLGYNVADFLNGAFEYGWEDVGITIGNGLNTALDVARGFLDKFSFLQFGRDVSSAINGFFTTVDWEEAGTVLSDGLIGLFESINTFLETTDWEAVGESIKTFIMSIKWEEIGDSIAKAVSTGFGNSFPKLMKGLAGEGGESWANEVVKNAKGMFKDITQLIDDVVSGITTTLISVKNIIEKLMKGDILGAAKWAMRGITQGFTNGMNFIIDSLNLFLTPFRAIITQIGNLSGQNWSISNIKIPRFPDPPALDTGTNRIEKEGLYHLHEDEAVVPKKYNPSADGYDNSKDFQQIISLLIDLNSNLVDYAERPINANISPKEFAEATYDDMQEISRNKNKSTIVVRS